MEKQEKGGDKGILARTATYTSKRARRAQEKLMQKVGKSDETKDEVFDEFVTNFNKQQSAATRLMKELRHYIQCVSSMQVATDAFAGAIREVYEDDWCQKDELVGLFEKLNKDWLTLHLRLSEDVLEPLNSYNKPFPEVRTKIAKRGRKLVDYDHCRHTVDTFRAKGTAKASDAKRLQQAEDDYQKAKVVFLELTSELYDELPALYDSRISFYVSCFQSIFTQEGVFHREATKVNNQLNEVMDKLIADVSTGSYSTRKPFPAAVPSDDAEVSTADDRKQPTVGSLATFYDVAVPESESAGDADSPSLEKERSSTGSIPSSEASSSPSISPRRDESPKTTPTPSIPPRPTVEPVPDAVTQTAESDAVTNGEVEQESSGPVVEKDNPEPTPESDVAVSQDRAVTTNEEAKPVPVARPAPPDNGEETSANASQETATEPTKGGRTVPDTLFKVIATFNYAGEDDDELTFERGELIHVIEFDDPDDQDEGWLYGVMDSSGTRGMFPENFTKRLT